jgi:ribosomal protein S18 acetylase RimI-like enzyme
MHFTLREAQPKDIPFLVDIVARTMPEVYRGIVPAKDMPERIDEVNSALLLQWPSIRVCECTGNGAGAAQKAGDALLHPGGGGGALAGMVNVVSGSHISLLWVDTCYHRQGVGRMLLKHAESAIFAAGHAEASLEVYKPNVRAVQFYAAHGWRTQEEFVGRVGAVVLRMVKRRAASPMPPSATG